MAEHVRDISALDGVKPVDLLTQLRSQSEAVMLHSGRMHRRWARWSIIAQPACWYQFDGASRWVGEVPSLLQKVPFAHDPLVDLDRLLAATRIDRESLPAGHLPFRGGWIGYFSYDLGCVIEPSARFHKPRGTCESCWPLIELAYCPNALIFDHLHQTWHAVGTEHATEDANEYEFDPHVQIGELHACIDPGRYMSMVSRTIDYIAAGDVFQSNISQPFEGSFEGSPRALACSAFEQAQPWYGSYLELPGESRRAMLSLSPELFLQANPCTRRIVTRPIKGTRPSSASARDLLDSAKDAAELHMIVDLMRNDLGKVCEFGSVRVPNPRSIESHPTVHHGVAEITGRLRSDVRFVDLLRATFPGGSVTGAPKIRAMQIIDELEDSPRGPYCGAIGFISDCGAATLNIAIRTMLIESQRHGVADPAIPQQWTVHYAAGAGIVADSDPRNEYLETLDKTQAMRLVINSAKHVVDPPAQTHSPMTV